MWTFPLSRSSSHYLFLCLFLCYSRFTSIAFTAGLSSSSLLSAFSATVAVVSNQLPAATLPSSKKEDAVEYWSARCTLLSSVLKGWTVKPKPPVHTVVAAGSGSTTADVVPVDPIPSTTDASVVSIVSTEDTLLSTGDTLLSVVDAPAVDPGVDDSPPSTA